MAHTVFHPADSRGFADHGWLKAAYSFSFSGWQDRERVHFGALRVLNDDIIAPGVGFNEHPHDNMEIITIVLEGALSHKDSMGNGAAIHPDEVQVMSAGSGLRHSEFNHSKTEAINSLQIWIFPKLRNITPRYEQRLFDAAGRQNRLQLLVAPDGAAGDVLTMNQDAWIYRSRLEAGRDLTYPLQATGNGVYIFLLEGSVTIDGQMLQRRDALGIWDTASFRMTAAADSEVLLLEVPMDF